MPSLKELLVKIENQEIPKNELGCAAMAAVYTRCGYCRLGSKHTVTDPKTTTGKIHKIQKISRIDKPDWEQIVGEHEYRRHFSDDCHWIKETITRFLPSSKTTRTGYIDLEQEA